MGTTPIPPPGPRRPAAAAAPSAAAGFAGDRPAAAAAIRHASYRSAELLRGLWLILPLTAALVLVATAGQPQPAWAQPLVALFTLLPLLPLGRLVIELRGEVLHWRYGWLGWPRWHLALADIAAVQLSRGPALHAGIQFNGRQRAFTARMGSPALELHTHDGRRILLGSPEPERLAQFIRVRLPEAR
jgi:hypothetical protein